MKYGKLLTKVALSGLIAAGAFAALSTASHAVTVTYKFYKGTTGYGGAYAGETMYTSTAPLSTDCPNGAATCPSDVPGDPLNFKSNTLQVSSPTTAYDDLDPNFGGIGVEPGGTDQIDGTDVLKFQFGADVLLTGVATLFYGLHDTFDKYNAEQVKTGAAAGIDYRFLLSTDGINFNPVSFLTANMNGLGILGIFSSTFYFKELTDAYQCPTDTSCGVRGLSYYISALRVTSESLDVLPPVPLPAALPLFFGGLAGLGGLARLRKRRQQAIATAA